MEDAELECTTLRVASNLEMNVMLTNHKRGKSEKGRQKAVGVNKKTVKKKK